MTRCLHFTAAHTLRRNTTFVFTASLILIICASDFADAGMIQECVAGICFNEPYYAPHATHVSSKVDNLFRAAEDLRKQPGLPHPSITRCAAKQANVPPTPSNQPTVDTTSYVQLSAARTRDSLPTHELATDSFRTASNTEPAFLEIAVLTLGYLFVISRKWAVTLPQFICLLAFNTSPALCEEYVHEPPWHEATEPDAANVLSIDGRLEHASPGDPQFQQKNIDIDLLEAEQYLAQLSGLPDNDQKEIETAVVFAAQAWENALCEMAGLQSQLEKECFDMDGNKRIDLEQQLWASRWPTRGRQIARLITVVESYRKSLDRLPPADAAIWKKGIKRVFPNSADTLTTTVVNDEITSRLTLRMPSIPREGQKYFGPPVSNKETNDLIFGLIEGTVDPAKPETLSRFSPATRAMLSPPKADTSDEHAVGTVPLEHAVAQPASDLQTLETTLTTAFQKDPMKVTIAGLTIVGCVMFLLTRVTSSLTTRSD